MVFSAIANSVKVATLIQCQGKSPAGEHTTLAGESALVTGGVRRMGGTVARTLYDAGMNLALPCRSNRGEI